MVLFFRNSTLNKLIFDVSFLKFLLFFCVIKSFKNRIKPIKNTIVVEKSSTFHGELFHLSWRSLPPFMEKASTFRGELFHLSWRSLPPFVAETRINTGVSGPRNQVIYQVYNQDIYQVNQSRKIHRHNIRKSVFFILIDR